MKRLPYQPGTCFTVPLRSSGYAIGVIARQAPKGKIILIYLFGPKLASPPLLSQVNELRSINAIKCVMAGDLGLMNGEWQVIGPLTQWAHEEWPVPTFCRREDFSNRTWQVFYSDTDPSVVEREEPVPNDTPGLERNSLMGYGSVEIMLTKLLDSEPRE